MQKLRWASRKWWFWVGLVVLIPVAWYVWGYVAYNAGIASKYGVQNAAREAYLNQIKAQDAILEAQYRADTYGGTTPEETLGLFVESLKRSDVELASKYYLIEDQDEARGALSVSKEKGYLGNYISILLGSHEGQYLATEQEYRIEFVDKSGNQIHAEYFKLNTFTDKWKIKSIR